MNVIVISGASSGVGKSSLARSLQQMLEGSVLVKIGHGKRKPHIENHFYMLGTPFHAIREEHVTAKWLLVESNAVLREIQPDLLIYVQGPNPKPSAELARRRADIISDEYISDKAIGMLAARLGITIDQMRAIVRLSGGLFDSDSAAHASA